MYKPITEHLEVICDKCGGYNWYVVTATNKTSPLFAISAEWCATECFVIIPEISTGQITLATPSADHGIVCRGCLKSQTVYDFSQYAATVGFGLQDTRFSLMEW